MYTLKYKEVKIKKDRVCWGCGFTIDTGKTMTYVVFVDGRDFGATYWCEVCEAFLRKNHSDFEDGIAEHEFRGESEYYEFKKDYLCQVRQVLMEKFTNPCKNIKLNGINGR